MLNCQSIPRPGRVSTLTHWSATRPC